MPSMQPRAKQLLTLAIVTGLLVLGVLIFATTAQGAAAFLRTPIGYAPAPPQLEARQAVQDWVPRPPAPKPVPALRQPTRLPEPSSGRCGGDLPPCWVMMRESRGNINARNPGGCSGRGCFGKWQFDPRTGDGTGSEAEQDAEARRVWDHGRGCSHWNACR